MIITYPLNGIEYTAQDAETYLCTRTSGVFSGDVEFIPEGMSITINPLLAWVQNSQFSGKSIAITEPIEITFDPAEAVLNRIDRIVLRFSAANNGSNIIILKGEPSSSPEGQDITRTEVIYDLCLAEVTFTPGMTEIAYENINSTILDENLCGIMRDGVTGIPTANLQGQVNDLLERLYDAIANVENNSAFLLKTGSSIMEGDFNNGGFKSRNLADPEDDNDATNKGYVYNNFLPVKMEHDIFNDLKLYYQDFTEAPGGFERMWLNPPMVTGEHYLTFERVNGDLTVSKLVNCGNLPNNSAKLITLGLSQNLDNLLITSFDVILRQKEYPYPSTNNLTLKLPAFDSTGNLMATAFIDANGRLYIRTFTDMSAYIGFLHIKYTRSIPR